MKLELGFNQEQFVAWSKLNEAIDAAESAPPCQNFPDVFYPSDQGPAANHEITIAKSLCLGCPVVRDCLEYAIGYETDGVWGGKTATERGRIRRAR